MAEPTRLHSRALHIGTRVVTALPLPVALGIVTASIVEGERDPIAWVVYGLFAVFFFTIYRTIWRTRPLRAEGDTLVVGGRRPRRVAFADIVSVDRPWWAFGDQLTAPLEIVLREGDPILFFPALGASDLIATRRRNAPR